MPSLVTSLKCVQCYVRCSVRWTVIVFKNISVVCSSVAHAYDYYCLRWCHCSETSSSTWMWIVLKFFDLVQKSRKKNTAILQSREHQKLSHSFATECTLHTEDRREINTAMRSIESNASFPAFQILWLSIGSFFFYHFLKPSLSRFYVKFRSSVCWFFGSTLNEMIHAPFILDIYLHWTISIWNTIFSQFFIFFPNTNPKNDKSTNRIMKKNWF